MSLNCSHKGENTSLAAKAQSRLHISFTVHIHEQRLQILWGPHVDYFALGNKIKTRDKEMISPSLQNSLVEY